MFLIMHTRKKATFVPGGVGGVGGAEKDTPLIGKCLHFCPPREARRYDGVHLIFRPVTQIQCHALNFKYTPTVRT